MIVFICTDIKVLLKQFNPDCYMIWLKLGIYTVDSEILARILFSRIALKDILVMWKIRD